MTTTPSWQRDPKAFFRQAGHRGGTSTAKRYSTKQRSEWGKQRGKKLKFNGEQHSISDWAKKLGMSHATIRLLLQQGWSVADALSTPVRKRVNRSPEEKKISMMWHIMRFHNLQDAAWNDYDTFVRDIGKRPSPKAHLVRPNKKEKFGPNNFAWKDYSKKSAPNKD